MTLNPPFIQHRLLLGSLYSSTIENILQPIREMSRSTWAPNLLRISQRFLSGQLKLIVTTPITATLPSLSLLWSATLTSFDKRLWQSYLPVLKSFWPINRLLFRPPPPSPYDTYKSALEEDTYWEKALSGQRIMQLSDAHFTRARSPHGVPEHDVYTPPLVMYYTPALLPEDFDAEARRKEKKMKGLMKGYRISAKNYWKWHWMVFPGQEHPSMKEANKLRYIHTPSELRMINRIARKIPDDKFFPDPKRAWNAKYQKMWLDWFNSPERDRNQAQAQCL